MENNFFLKMKGTGKTPLRVNGKDAVTGLIGGFMTILTLASLTAYTSSLWLMAPFGASCVLVFSAWNAPLSQPRNVIGGHLFPLLLGLLFFTYSAPTHGPLHWGQGLPFA